MKSFLLVLLFTMPTFLCLALGLELFPWSHFPMYSGLDSGKNLKLISAYYVNEKNKEQSLESSGILRPKYEYRSRLEADELYSRDLRPEERAILENFGGIFKENLREKQISFSAIRFYLEFWADFSGPQRLNPNQRRLLIEITN